MVAPPRGAAAIESSVRNGKEVSVKKLVVFLLVLLFAAGYVACGGKSYSAPTQPVMTTPSPGAPPAMTPTPSY
jgi:hypothetical protein